MEPYWLEVGICNDTWHGPRKYGYVFFWDQKKDGMTTLHSKWGYSKDWIRFHLRVDEDGTLSLNTGAMAGDGIHYLDAPVTVMLPPVGEALHIKAPAHERDDDERLELSISPLSTEEAFRRMGQKDHPYAFIEEEANPFLSYLIQEKNKAPDNALPIALRFASDLMPYVNASLNGLPGFENEKDNALAEALLRFQSKELKEISARGALPKFEDWDDGVAEWTYRLKSLYALRPTRPVEVRHGFRLRNPYHEDYERHADFCAKTFFFADPNYHDTLARGLYDIYVLHTTGKEQKWRHTYRPGPYDFTDEVQPCITHDKEMRQVFLEQTAKGVAAFAMLLCYCDLEQYEPSSKEKALFTPAERSEALRALMEYSIERKDPLGLVICGHCFALGKGTEKNMERAEKLYETARACADFAVLPIYALRD
ncbi:MAG: hypothetical protein K6E59_06775 [Bacilli bacterium]|nr:hypothetical protein [Bacilli bacterium]